MESSEALDVLRSGRAEPVAKSCFDSPLLLTNSVLDRNESVASASDPCQKLEFRGAQAKTA